MNGTVSPVWVVVLATSEGGLPGSYGCIPPWIASALDPDAAAPAGNAHARTSRHRASIPRTQRGVCLRSSTIAMADRTGAWLGMRRFGPLCSHSDRDARIFT